MISLLIGNYNDRQSGYDGVDWRDEKGMAIKSDTVNQFSPHILSDDAFHFFLLIQSNKEW